MLSCLVLALLIVQWGLIQHIESHLSGNDRDNCQICLVGYHMANAVSYTPLSIPVTPALADKLITVQSEFCCSPLIAFLVRAPPVLII